MDGSRIDLDLLQALEALLAERNVTRAAKRLGLSQPALSARLARLRVFFDDTLLVPGRRGMTPTAKSLELQDPLREALDRLRGLVQASRSFDPTKARLTVRIAASDYSQVAVLIDFALRLRKAAPGIRLAILSLDVAALAEQMERGAVDVGLITPELAPSSLRRLPLFEESYLAVVRRDHPTVRQSLGLARFLRLEHMIVSPLGGGFTTPVDATLAAHPPRASGKMKREVVLSAASFLFVIEAIRRSDLVALVPSRLVEGHRDHLRIFPPPLAVQGFRMLMTWHDRNHDHVGHRWMRQMLADVAGEGRPR